MRKRDEKANHELWDHLLYTTSSSIRTSRSISLGCQRTTKQFACSSSLFSSTTGVWGSPGCCARGWMHIRRPSRSTPMMMMMMSTTSSWSKILVLISCWLYGQACSLPSLQLGTPLLPSSGNCGFGWRIQTSGDDYRWWLRGSSKLDSFGVRDAKRLSSADSASSWGLGSWTGHGATDSGNSTPSPMPIASGVLELATHWQALGAGVSLLFRSHFGKNFNERSRQIAWLLNTCCPMSSEPVTSSPQTPASANDCGLPPITNTEERPLQPMDVPPVQPHPPPRFHTLRPAGRMLHAAVSLTAQHPHACMRQTPYMVGAVNWV